MQLARAAILTKQSAARIALKMAQCLTTRSYTARRPRLNYTARWLSLTTQQDGPGFTTQQHSAHTACTFAVDGSASFSVHGRGGADVPAAAAVPVAHRYGGLRVQMARVVVDAVGLLVVGAVGRVVVGVDVQMGLRGCAAERASGGVAGCGVQLARAARVEQRSERRGARVGAHDGLPWAAMRVRARACAEGAAPVGGVSACKAPGIWEHVVSGWRVRVPVHAG